MQEKVKLYKNLADKDAFDVKIIDLGLAKRIVEISQFSSVFGDSFVRAPEQDREG